ncbi:MAG: phytanoyl-CoA dioxygenase family protein [Pseudomonadota bacterium]
MVDLPTTSDPEELTRLRIERFAHELDDDGLTIVPPSVLDLPESFFVQLRETVLSVAKQQTGASFDLARGIDRNLGGRPDEIGHVMITHLVHQHPAFEQVLTHPVKKALMSHLLGPVHRLSHSSAWIKWKTPNEWTKVMSTGMHADQSRVPEPWHWRAPHMANMNWLLTDYTREDGALSYVPRSHKEERFPPEDEANERAVPVEAPMGSLVIFQGGTWHGSFRKTTPGLRVSLHGVHCRPYKLPGQDYKGQISATVFNRSADPSYLHMLMRDDEEMLAKVPASAE